MTMLRFMINIGAYMKHLIALVATLSLVACSSVPKVSETKTETKNTEVRTSETRTSSNDNNVVAVNQYPTVPDFEVRALTRTEVIQAVDQCNDSGMKPFVEYIAQKTAFGRIMTPVNVHCNPNRKPN